MTHDRSVLTSEQVESEHIPYRPSNAFEGTNFMMRWCYKCALDRAFQEDKGDSCPIAAMSMVEEIDSPLYPTQWRQDGPSGPRCTEFVAVNEADQPIDPAAVVRPLL